jgi:hypothetical protein
VGWSYIFLTSGWGYIGFGVLTLAAGCGAYWVWKRVSGTGHRFVWPAAR